MPSVLLGCNAVRDAYSGMAGCMLRVGAELAGRGWEVHECFAPEVHRLPARVSRQLAYGRVAVAVARARPDVAIVASGDGILVPLVPGRRRFIAESHGLERDRREEVERHGMSLAHFGRGHRLLREPAVAVAARAADALVVKTTPQAAFAVDRLGVDPRRVHVIPNGVDEGFFAVRRSPAPTPVVLVVGSWTELKGCRLLPGVFAALHDLVPDVRLHLVGTGEGAAGVLLAFAPELRGQVHVVPHATRAEVQSACASAHVGLQLSAYEGFGLALAEMVASGLPVVSTPVGAATDLITSRDVGQLVAVHGGAAAFAAAIAAQLGHVDAPGEEARRRAAATHLRWPMVGDRWDALCRALLP